MILSQKLTWEKLLAMVLEIFESLQELWPKQQVHNIFTKEFKDKLGIITKWDNASILVDMGTIFKAIYILFSFIGQEILFAKFLFLRNIGIFHCVTVPIILSVPVPISDFWRYRYQFQYQFEIFDGTGTGSSTNLRFLTVPVPVLVPIWDFWWYRYWYHFEIFDGTGTGTWRYQYIGLLDPWLISCE